MGVHKVSALHPFIFQTNPGEKLDWPSKNTKLKRCFVKTNV
jgi:hypothetical protein